MARKVYSEEFKKGAVEQVIAQRHTVTSVAERLGIGYDTLRKWVELARYNADKSLGDAVERNVRERRVEPVEGGEAGGDDLGEHLDDRAAGGLADRGRQPEARPARQLDRLHAEA